MQSCRAKSVRTFVVADVCLCTTYDCNLALNFASFILIACDGLWKVFSVEEATKFIISVLEVRIRVYSMTWNDSLVSMPFPSLVFDCLQFSKYGRGRPGRFGHMQ